MVDRPITPTPSTGYAAEVAYPPTPLPTPPAPVVQPSRPVTPTPTSDAISAAIIHHESGGKNIVSPVGATGPGQIMPATFRQYARPGERIDNPADNIAVHKRIIDDYMHRYNGDVARVSVAYFSGPGNVAPAGSPTPWIKNSSDGNNSVAQYVANTAGKMGVGPSGPPVAATPTAPAKSNLGEALRKGDIGGAVKALTEQDEKGKSMLGDAAKAVSPQQQGGGGEAPQMLQAPPPMNPVAASAPGAAQLMSQVIAARGRPLTWSAAPFGSGIAGPQVPGTTLNSGGGYG